MAVWDISDEEIETTERMLLPDSCHFAEDAKKVIRCWSSTDVSACPGSGKTTVLLAKLKLVADRMPLDNGAGICVLSHTNVAVNEIKSKLSTCAEKLLNYPNFIGTIQAFIDRFVTFPYIRTMTKVSLQVVDERTYAQHFYSMLVHNTNYQTLDKFIKQIYRRSNDYNTDIIGYIQNLCVKNGALYYKKSEESVGWRKDSSSKTVFRVKGKVAERRGPPHLSGDLPIRLTSNINLG